MKPCPDCGGYGHTDWCYRRRIYPACKPCKGTGRISPNDNNTGLKSP